MMDWLIIANGLMADIAFITAQAQGRKILVCDGAYRHLAKTAINVDVLLGDFDSIDPILLAVARENKAIQIVKTPNQNATDLDKAIYYLDQQQACAIHIFSALGLQTDHALHNLRILKRHHKRHRTLSIETETEIIYFIENDTIRLQGRSGDAVAIFGFDDAILSSSGLKYDVDHYRLGLSGCDSARNALMMSRAELVIEGQALLILSRHIIMIPSL